MFSLRGISIALLLVVAAIPAAAWFAGSAMVWRRFPLIAFDPPPPARNVGLRTSDGLCLTATYWAGAKSDAPGVLILHGIGASRHAQIGNAGWLAQQGFAVLALDLRGHGQSDFAPHTFGLTESRDARAAFDWLKSQQQGAPVGVVGISLGGAAALLGDEGPLPAQSFVLVSVYSDIDNAIRNRVAAMAPEPIPTLLTPLLKYQAKPRFGVGPDRLRPIEALRKVSAPVLVVGGGADVFTPPDESRRMGAVAAADVLLLDGLNHRQATWTETPAYRARLRDFFTTALGKP
jgi:pimeloyl-ACP methyl ester carboxylesterase